MHALKTPSFLWPSRSAPAPVPSRTDSGVEFEALPSMSRPSSKGPLNRLALASRKRPPTSLTPPPTPTLVQDGSYLEALSLKLSEAVSRALAQPTGPPLTGEVLWNGKKALPKGRGTALGALIGSELEASASNPHLHRAILRSLHRPLSVLLTNLSAQLLPVVSSPQFTSHASPTMPSPVQLYGAAYANFASELLESLDARGLGQADTQGVSGAVDNLRSIREGLESLVGRVVHPLASGIRNELLPLIETLERDPQSPASSPPQSKPGPALSKGSHVSLHPSIAILQNLIPFHARNLAQYSMPPTTASQTMLATLLISLLWRGLVALSHRDPITTPSCQAPPVTLPQLAVPALRKKRVGGSTTPPNTPPSVRFSIKLPPSRPPSPQAVQVPCPASDAHVLYDLLSILPRPSGTTRYVLAREAVDEAFGGLSALCALLDYEAAGYLEDLDVVTADLPTVIALPVLLRIFVRRGQNDLQNNESWSVSSLLGLTHAEYRDACLGGFSRAEECGPMVAKRVLDALVHQRITTSDGIIHWLESRASLGDL